MAGAGSGVREDSTIRWFGVHAEHASTAAKRTINHSRPNAVPSPLEALRNFLISLILRVCIAVSRIVRFHFVEDLFLVGGFTLAFDLIRCRFALGVAYL